MDKKTVNLTTDDISVTEDGRIVISNVELTKNFIETLKADPGTAGIFDNCDCTRGKMREVSLAGKMKPRALTVDLGAAEAIFDNCSCSRG